MKLKQRFIAYLLIFIVTFSTVFSSYTQSVYAQGEVAVAIWEGIQWALSMTDGYSISGDLAKKVYEKYKDSFDAISYTQNANGTITFSEEALRQIETLFEQYLEETPEAVDVVWMPVISSDQLAASYFYSTNLYYKFRSYADNVRYSVINTAFVQWDYFRFADVSDRIFYQGSTSFNPENIRRVNLWTEKWGRPVTAQEGSSIGTFVGGDGGLVLSRTDSKYDGAYTETGVGEVDQYYGSRGNWGGLLTNIQYPFVELSSFYSQPDYIFLVRGCNTDATAYVPIFVNLNAYKNWITGSGSYYRFDSGYQGGDITINPNADYSAITDAIKNSMQQSIANGDNMSTMLSHMQSAFSQKLDEINNTLGDISDNTGETNSWLEKIYDLLVKIDKKVNGILVADTVDTAVDILSELWGNIWNWINNKLEMVEIVQQVSELGNVMKRKFPFSIPWDVYSILLMFDAPAKPPVIRLHFEFPMLDDYAYDYEYVMDDKAWSDFAFVCRFFLTIGYQISLMHLTQKLYASGLFDMPAPGKRKK